MAFPAVDQLLSQMSVGQTAALAMELVGDELEQAQAHVSRKAFECVRNGTLTPEQAMNFWFEKHALFTLQTRLTQKMNVGRSSAMKAAAELEEADPYAR